MLIMAGSVVVLITVYFLMKQYETRMVLFCSGLTMAIIAGDPMAAFNAFSRAMKEYKVIEPVVTVMGFAFVTKLTECDKHLIYLLVKGLKKAGPLIIPGATLATFIVNTSLTTAAGASAAVGAILIPFLLTMGVHPAIAGAAVLAGTYGAFLNPGYQMNAVISDVAKTAPMQIVTNHALAVVVAMLIGAVSLTVVAYLRHEHKDYIGTTNDSTNPDSEFKVNLLKAFVPIFPLSLLLVASSKIVPGMQVLGISHSMILGVFLAFIVTRQDPGEISKKFFSGMGEGFGHIYGILISAIVFVGGMNSVGLIKALTDAMIANPYIAKIAAAYGPFIIAVVSGSGDGPAVAFNKAVTVNAADFGMSPMNMGSMVALGSGLGRSMSPIAGAAVICASFAGCSPMEVAKRNALGMIIAVTVTMILLLYF